MKKISCLAIDDDPASLLLLENYVSGIPFLYLYKTCNTAIEAIEILEKEPIDLLFLDINMPEINGIQLLKSIKPGPSVIFTTAHSEYALEGYEHDIIDFLLKPFGFDRFLKAVNKCHSHFLKWEMSNSPSQQHLFVKSNYKLIRINIDDILFVEGLKDYIKIYTRHKLILTLMSMTTIESKLPSDRFLRIHRSFIIPLNKIDSISRHRVIIGEKFIPISTPYRDNFYSIIEKAI